jgi:hypothetical protein
LPITAGFPNVSNLELECMEDLALRLFGVTFGPHAYWGNWERPVRFGLYNIALTCSALPLELDVLRIVSPAGRSMLRIAPAELNEAEGEIYRALRNVATPDRTYSIADATVAAKGVLAQTPRTQADAAGTEAP